VLVEMSAVEVSEAVLVRGEVRGHPVQDHSDAALVQLIDQLHEVLGRPEAAGGGEEAGRLVAPGTEEGVLHDGH
jgi:hypothetical protein